MSNELTWSEYWKEVLKMLSEDEDNSFFNTAENIIKIKPLFKKKWSKGVDVNSAYYDIVFLI